MIKANELRIGNNFFYKGEIKTVLQIRDAIVYNIYKIPDWRQFDRLFNTEIAAIDEVQEVSFEDAEPIALSNVSSDSFDIHNKFFEEIIETSEGFQLSDGATRNIGMPILYLHQLQNLYFALTGEELKIEI